MHVMYLYSVCYNVGQFDDATKNTVKLQRENSSSVYEKLKTLFSICEFTLLLYFMASVIGSFI